MTSKIIPLLFVLLNLEIVERNGKNYKNYLENEKSFFDEVKKTFFIIFAGLSFDEEVKI